MTQNEFFKRQLPPTTRKRITSVLVFMYLSTIITFLMSFGNIYHLVDVFLLIVLTIIFQVKKSRVCIIIYAVYFLLSKFAMPGSFNFWTIMFTIIIIQAIPAVFQFQKLWHQYKNDDIMLYNNVDQPAEYIPHNQNNNIPYQNPYQQNTYNQNQEDYNTQDNNYQVNSNMREQGLSDTQKELMREKSQKYNGPEM